jgi:hypothetical protein
MGHAISASAIRRCDREKFLFAEAAADITTCARLPDWNSRGRGRIFSAQRAARKK